MNLPPVLTFPACSLRATSSPDHSLLVAFCLCRRKCFLVCSCTETAPVNLPPVLTFPACSLRATSSPDPSLLVAFCLCRRKCFLVCSYTETAPVNLPPVLTFPACSLRATSSPDHSLLVAFVARCWNAQLPQRPFLQVLFGRYNSMVAWYW